MCLSKPKMPEMPEPPKEPDRAQVVQRRKQKQASAMGQKATLLTGSRGLSSAPVTQRKTLLGP
ncbi:MAG: hypothetical protein HQL54_03655 [Magnetococcales bacterium]|nr:hypothetical protein [Magnetococcales bacterium]